MLNSVSVLNFDIHIEQALSEDWAQVSTSRPSLLRISHPLLPMRWSTGRQKLDLQFSCSHFVSTSLIVTKKVWLLSFRMTQLRRDLDVALTLPLWDLLSGLVCYLWLACIEILCACKDYEQWQVVILLAMVVNISGAWIALRYLLLLKYIIHVAGAWS